MQTNVYYPSGIPTNVYFGSISSGGGVVGGLSLSIGIGLDCIFSGSPQQITQSTD